MSNRLLAILLLAFCASASAEPECLLDARSHDMYNGGRSPWNNQLTRPVLKSDAPHSGDCQL